MKSLRRNLLFLADALRAVVRPERMTFLGPCPKHPGHWMVRLGPIGVGRWYCVSERCYDAMRYCKATR